MENMDVSCVQDIWADGCFRVEILGAVCRTLYWKWAVMGGLWIRQPIEIALVRPLAAFPADPREWAKGLLFEPPKIGH